MKSKEQISMEGLNNLTSLRNLRIASNPTLKGLNPFMVRKIFEFMHYLFTVFAIFTSNLVQLFLTGGEDEVLKLSNLEYLDLGG
ncbi:hypothetical protein NC652_015192 [Populus alba x Populus x berolinensis]|nr:hypothetical protein NC652_015192 [Populus alba x Populus x berolinensis]